MSMLSDEEIDQLEALLDDLFPGRKMRAEFRVIFAQAKLANAKSHAAVAEVAERPIYDAGCPNSSAYSMNNYIDAILVKLAHATLAKEAAEKEVALRDELLKEMSEEDEAIREEFRAFDKTDSLSYDDTLNIVMRAKVAAEQRAAAMEAELKIVQEEYSEYRKQNGQFGAGA